MIPTNAISHTMSAIRFHTRTRRVSGVIVFSLMSLGPVVGGRATG
jgi:hypothetical protein